MSRAAHQPASFLFLAAKADGGRTMGLRRADSERHLAEQLRRDRLVALRTWRLPAWAAAAPRLKLKDNAELNTQLAQLLGRGVPLVEALDVTAAAVSENTRPIVRRMREMVASGSSFADACQAAGVFDRVTIAVYRAAERSGDLGGAAKTLAATAKRQLALTGKAATLMIYPAIVLSISVLVCIVMLTIVVPKIGEALVKANAQLPAITRTLMSVGITMRDHWMGLLLGILIFITLIVMARRQIAEAANRASRRIPLLRDVVLSQESARFFTVMAAMTKSGVPLSDALGTGSQAIGHPELRQQLVTLRTRLVEGGVLRNLIDNVTTLSLPTRRLLIAAERSGDLESAFESLAADLVEETDRRSSRLLAALEPALIVVMFLMIGSLMLSVMGPLMKASSQAFQ